jgi:hypothetical protein
MIFRRKEFSGPIVWVYQCKAGVYAEDSLYKLLVTIYKHRLQHLLKDKKWMD